MSIAIGMSVNPVNDSLARSQTPVIAEMMGVFEKLFGPYPFFSEKYGHAQFVFSGGMEHQTMSFMGNFNFDLQAHELAHQWFGNTITCGSWQDIWLNEGFATYLTMLCHEHLRGDSAFQAGMNLMRNRIMREPDGSVVVPAEDTLNVSRVFSGRLSYEKGAWVLHMLRFVLGDEAFYSGLNDYFYAQRHHHGFVSTEDLRIALESASGQDLDGFFNQWVYGQGYPQFDLRWQAQSNQLSIQLTQRTSTPVWDYFDIPVPVLVMGEGRDSMILLHHRSSTDSFRMNLPFRIEQLIADPHMQILAKIESVRKQTDEQKVRIELFPNPASDVLRVQSDSIRFSAVRIFNLHGSLLHEEVIENQSNGSWSYALSALSGGLYFLEIITDDNRRVVQKFIRE
jgi:aminopeptidase N